MGSKSKSRKKRHEEKELEDDDFSSLASSSSSSYSSQSDSDDIERSSRRRKSSHKRRRSDDEKRRREKRRREKEKKRKRKERLKHSSSSSKKSKRDRRKMSSDSDSSASESEGPNLEEAEEVVRCMLREFPSVAGDLEQLLQMVDDGQAVDINGLSEKMLVRHLRKLFLSLNLKENSDNVFLLRQRARLTLAAIQPIIQSLQQSQEQQLGQSAKQTNVHSTSSDHECKQKIDTDTNDTKEDITGPRRRVIGPEMPSSELLAAAAKLTEAEAELRKAELEEDAEFFIGPPPPAVVSEVQSANEAERFEEVTRIIGAEVDSPYDILGVNRNMSDENIKKRYWKLSLMVHPDKCSHPQAHQAFIKLNKAFKDLQDADKRRALDEKIKEKEKEEEFKADLQAMREAAQWRRLQGISMEGDDILLAEMNAQVGPKRDEWMTTLPPERKPGMSMHSRTFSKTSREGRGDTSVWTDTPLERAQKAQKAKMNYLEAYNEAAALASKEQDMKKANAEAELVDQYNKAKRSKSLVEQHKESSRSGSKKKSKQKPVKEEWEGNHPWRPWDREKDLTAGRQNVKFDSESMADGMSSRFSSGSFQRSFL